MDRKSKRRKGSAVIEFTLVGIPVIFLLISVFEISRGMWLYHTLASAVRAGTRFAVVHGGDCNIPPNSCGVRVRDIAARIRDSSTGLRPVDVQNLTFTSGTRVVTCGTLDDCLKSGSPGDTYWPADAPGSPMDIGANRRAPVEIAASYRFQSAIAMFWPGAGGVNPSAAVVLPASSRESIQY